MAAVVEAEHRHALDQRDTLAPVVERGERADHAHHRVGHVAVVGRHVRQPLDLADDVVAEVAHQPAVQRRQLGDDGRPVRGQQVLERGEDPPIARHVDGQRAVDLDPPVAQHERGDGVPADEREAAPPLAVLDRLEQEPRAVTDELGVRRDRRLQVGQQLGPHRHDRVRAGQRAELVPAGADAHYALPRSLARRLSAHTRPEAAVEAGAVAGVAGPVAVLVTLNSSTSASQS